MGRWREVGHGGRVLRLPRNVVYEALHAAGGPAVVQRQLGVSSATVARWRRTGIIRDAAKALALARLAERDDSERELDLAWRLAGLG